MNAREIKIGISHLFDEINSINTIIEKSSCSPRPIKKSSYEKIINGKQLSSGFLDIYQCINNFELIWESKTDPNILGKIKILDIETMLSDWEGVIYFEGTTPLDDPLRSFHPIDFFADETCVGIYLDPDLGTSMHLYGMEGEPLDLDIDLEGYIILLIKSRGFLYWQDALRAELEGVENPMAGRFRQVMPRIFPGFNHEEFISQYRNLRRSKN